jgi:hypothetical protein
MIKDCETLFKNKAVAPPHYDETKKVVSISTSIPLPDFQISRYNIWNCYEEYLEISGQIRDCLLKKELGPTGWSRGYLLMDMKLKAEVGCPDAGTLGVVQYSAAERESSNYESILRDICVGKKFQISQQAKENGKSTLEEINRYYLDMAANTVEVIKNGVVHKPDAVANAGNYGRASYKYNCHEYNLDCISGKFIEDVKLSGRIWGCWDDVISHNEF